MHSTQGDKPKRPLSAYFVSFPLPPPMDTLLLLLLTRTTSTTHPSMNPHAIQVCIASSHTFLLLSCTIH